MQLSRYSFWLSVMILVSMSACKFNCQVGSGPLSALEDDILSKQKAAGITSVSCPMGPDLTDGATFECTGEGENGKKATYGVTVKLEGDKPFFNWALKE